MINSPDDGSTYMSLLAGMDDISQLLEIMTSMVNFVENKGLMSEFEAYLDIHMN